MEPLIRFFAHATRLKTLKRSGWGRCGVEPCESVAEHTFGVALLALLLPSASGIDVNRDRCVALALVHDLAESIVGDITPHDAVEPSEKRRREEAAIRELSNLLGNDELLTLWLEFEAGATKEAQLVRDLDVIEMAWQAKTYEQTAQLEPAQAAEFIASATSRIRAEAGRRLLQSMVRSS